MMLSSFRSSSVTGLGAMCIASLNGDCDYVIH